MPPKRKAAGKVAEVVQRAKTSRASKPTAREEAPAQQSTQALVDAVVSALGTKLVDLVDQAVAARLPAASSFDIANTMRPSSGGNISSPESSSSGQPMMPASDTTSPASTSGQPIPPDTTPFQAAVNATTEAISGNVSNFISASIPVAANICPKTRCMLPVSHSGGMQCWFCLRLPAQMFQLLGSAPLPSVWGTGGAS